jgi:2-hydroxychromene-2-carboxylate isomerase
MSRKLEFFFDYASPTTYLAYTQLAGILDRTKAKLVWKPMLLGGLYKSIGNQMPALLPPRGAYMFTDLMRCAKHYDVPLNFSPFFPVKTIFLLCASFVAHDMGRLHDFADMAFKGIWVEEKNMGDPDVVAETMMAHGFDPDYMVEHAGKPENKAKLKAITEEAATRGAFGAPTFFVDETEMFFGQDRLHFVEAALTK